jgi:hypothetical protein
MKRTLLVVVLSMVAMLFAASISGARIGLRGNAKDNVVRGQLAP